MGRQSQFVAAIEPRVTAPLLVPGVADDDRAYTVSPVAIRAIGHRRVAGGTSIAAGEFESGGFLLLSQNPLLVSHLNRQIAVMRRKAIGLEIELARAALAEAERVAGELTPMAGRGADPRLAEARTNLQQAERFASLSDLAASLRMMRRMHQGVSLYERATWESATRGLTSPVASPCAASFATLPDHLRLMAQDSIRRLEYRRRSFRAAIATTYRRCKPPAGETFDMTRRGSHLTSSCRPSIRPPGRPACTWLRSPRTRNSARPRLIPRRFGSRPAR